MPVNKTSTPSTNTQKELIPIVEKVEPKPETIALIRYFARTYKGISPQTNEIGVTSVN